MAFWIASSPHNHIQNKTSKLMRLVTYALIPGILVQWYFFGWGNIFQILLASIAAISAEFAILSLRKREVTKELFDGSALLTAVLLGISLPALAPWWIAVIGAIFAIVIAKHLYGGLGNNPFNPAMAAYVVLLVSFPLQMTAWQPPLELMTAPLSVSNTLSVIFTNYTIDGYSLEQLRMHVDGYTMATPLDTLKTNLTVGLTVTETISLNIFGDNYAFGWEWINIAFLLGGCYLLYKKAIAWQTPVSFLASLFVLSFLAFLISPDTYGSPIFHLVSGATMLGAFFILTDPVSGATSVKGRLIFGALAGLLVFLIRNYGGYPDAVAFAVLLCNMSAPLIDQFTRPRTYGHQAKKAEPAKNQHTSEQGN